ncbi:MAG: hypothetical protein HY901_28700 [Deltaproteobacteria bacterium]|nr:hypothetical protein [Deltaproteobacteria bacterium]
MDPNGASARIELTHTPLPLVFDPTPSKISSLHKAATRLTGTCTEIGGLVDLTGDASGATTCLDGTWSIVVDLSTLRDGPVDVMGVQWTASHVLSSVPVARQYIKETAHCDDLHHLNGAPFASGTGSPADPYVACSGTQLTQLASHPDASIKLQNDIDIGGAPWTPLDTLTGTLDGNGFVVENLYFPDGSNYAGLFASSSGTIKNLGVVNVNMVGGCHLGALVGILNQEGVVQDCYSTGIIQTTSDSVGGLVGQSYGTILRAYSSVAITASASYDIGGLVGHSTETGIVRQSYATGAIEVTHESNAGGLIGENGGTVDDCYATGSVTADSDSSSIGGLIGLNTGPLQSSYSSGPVSGEGSLVGGLIGENTGAVTSSYWDLETSGQPSSAAGAGLTTANMGDQSSYSGWDFTTVWEFDSSRPAYPILRWQE